MAVALRLQDTTSAAESFMRVSVMVAQSLTRESTFGPCGHSLQRNRRANFTASVSGGFSPRPAEARREPPASQIRSTKQNRTADFSAVDASQQSGNLRTR